MNHIFTGKLAIVLGVSAMAFATVSCDDEPDKYKSTGGKPVVEYVRSTDPAAADSLLTGAYLSNTVCLVGKNLRAVHELYFNDQKAVLNTSLITDNHLIVTLPSQIPAKVTDNLYMINYSGDTIPFPFKSLVPAPKASTMSCEWAPAGSTAVIYGDFFVNDPSMEMTITDGAGNKAEITALEQTKLTITVPDNWEPGYLNLTSIYGKSKSKFRYKDDLNILFDFDGSHGGLLGGHGWHNAKVYADLSAEGVSEVTPIDGSFMAFGVTASWGADSWGAGEDDGHLEYWPEDTPENPRLSSMPDFADILKRNDWTELQVKFEMCVPASRPWKSTAMSMMFTPSSVVHMASKPNNEYLYESGVWEGVGYARGFYQPYAELKDAGFNFNTNDEWITVSMPLSAFRFNKNGEAMTELYNKDSFDGFTIVFAGGDAGADCEPVICVDNIRVVPIE